MRRQFVRPQIHTQVEGDCAPATRVGGLYGMDVEGGNEDLEMEQSEFEGFEGLDTEVPAEAQEDSTEAHDARIKPSPVMPTAEEVAKHDATHCPFRSWCTTCVAASAREDPHPRGKKCRTEMGLPVVQMDYDLLEEQLTILIVKDALSGAALAYDCETKGPGDAWVVKQLAADIADWGRPDICLMADGEPAMTALQQAIAKARPGNRTLLKNSPPYNPQSNGGAEKAAQDVIDIARRLVLALEARLRQKLDLASPIVKWLIRHAAFILTRYQVGHDGHTAWRRLTGRNWSGVVAELGEQVLGKLALKRPSTDRKVKKGKRKLAQRSIQGTWVGIFPRTGEHIIALSSGEAIRVRTIHRLPMENRWDAAAVTAVRALPRKPVPQREDAAPQTRLASRNELERQGPILDGSRLERLEVMVDEKVPRELRIDGRLLDKFGCSDNCVGCLHRQLKLEGHRPHSSTCRQRIYNAMINDADELDRMQWNEQRMGRDVARSKEIPRAPVPVTTANASAADNTSQTPQRAQEGATASAAPEPLLETPRAEVDIPVGYVEDIFDTAADDDVNMENEMPSLIQEASEEDVGPAGPYEQDTDSDDEGGEEPPSKKAREVYMFGVSKMNAEVAAVDGTCEDHNGPLCATGVAGAIGVLPDETAVETPIQQTLRQQAKDELKSLMATAEVKRILQEIEEQSELQLPRSSKKQPRLARWIKDCAEVYSLPRVTEVASRMRMKSAWALDLTTLDEEGNPWDFSLPRQRKKALELLKKDKPLFLVACPMCGPFSSINDLNYGKMSEEEIRKKLQDAMMHMRFALSLCLVQVAEGRMFMFEHPAGASSWGTKMMQEMLSKEGVYLAKFDFCQLDMKVLDKSGVKASAKKRTAVMTNSKHLAEMLRQAQCDGSHRHEPLVSGKAKQCEVYPEKFARLICTAIKREIADVKWRRKTAKTFEIGNAIEKLMAVQTKMECAEPPHEQAGSTRFQELYAGQEFVDDVSGLHLNKDLAIQARRVEIEFFKTRGVYEKVFQEPWMGVITTKWLDVNKGDEVTPNYRARLVGREIAWEKRDDLYAATPPLESLKALVSVCSSSQQGASPHRIMAVDVKRAYFYAPATRDLFVKIPKEDKEDGDEGMVAKLRLSLYGTRDAALNWANTYTEFLEKQGFTRGRGCSCNFSHPRGIIMTVHGDDFTSSASTKNLEWLKRKFEEKFEVTAKLLGPEVGQEREIRVLNRVIRWEADGLVYEPDQRHAEMIIREFGLEGAGSVLTPGTRGEQEVASAPDGVLGLTVEDETEEMATADATQFRGLAARGNYLAQDRVDIQYACKEASRRMAKPRVGDWQLLKRIARYLVGAPRYEQRFRWQNRPSQLDIFTDSDWAGCKTTCRSTSGGVALWGSHCIKTWSSTQATIALSSAEAELYALTKGAAQGLGMMTLMEDFGIPTAVTVHTDASAAIGIVRRAGLGKLRHLNVRYFWLQSQVKQEAIGIQKVAGADNPADLVTKHLNAETMKKHMERVGVRTSGGRARSAPILGVFGHRGRRKVRFEGGSFGAAEAQSRRMVAKRPSTDKPKSFADL